MKKDLFIAFLVFSFVIAGGYLYKFINENSYAVNFEDDNVNLDSYVEQSEDNYKKYVENKENEDNKKYETDLTIEDVYQSIYAMKDTNINTIDEKMNDIYINFYKYFDSNNLFYNMYGESYTYDEYMFLKEHHLMRNNDEIFGLYLTTYKKCEVFGLVDSDEMNNYIKYYCTTN